MTTDSARLKSLARNHRRRWLRRAGLRASTLDAIGASHLEQWAQLRARLDLLDEAGAGSESTYVTVSNSATRSMRLLEVRLKELDLVASASNTDPARALRDWAANRNGATS